MNRKGGQTNVTDRKQSAGISLPDQERTDTHIKEY